MTPELKHGTYVGADFALKGKTALLMLTDEGVKAQFDDVATGFRYGWHLLPDAEWEYDPDDA